MKSKINSLTVRLLGIIAIIVVFTLSAVICHSQTINSADALKEFLDKQPANSPDKPIKVSMIISDLWFENVVDVIKSSGKYVSLNLSGSTITIIPDNAFFDKDKLEGCKTLVGITIPNSVTSIGNSAFDFCENLISVTIPDSVTSIGKSAFFRCRKLTSVTIPNNVISIGGGAFSGCTNLTSITITNSVKSIGEYAFNNCTSLTSIIIPDSVTSIGGRAFSYCKSLTAINVAAGNNSYISDNGILFEKGKTFVLHTYPAGKTDTSFTIPKSVTSIGGGAFSGCTSLTSVTIPNSITSIGQWTFSGCTSLTSVTIPNSVTSIGQWTFSGCTSLASVTIPNSVTNIGGGAFSNCEKLTAINVATGNNAYISDNGILFGKGKTFVLHTYPAGKTDTSFTIPKSVTIIGEWAFAGSGITNITIPNSVTNIGHYAFYNCTSLISVTFATGSNITDANFKDSVFPEGSDSKGGNTLKTAYKNATKKAGTYTRTAGGSTWTKS